MADTVAFIELFEASLDLIELPALRLDKSRDRFRGKKRLRTTGSLGKRLEPLLGIDAYANGKGCRHVIVCVTLYTA
jgi:hypothetical protein